MKQNTSLSKELWRKFQLILHQAMATSPHITDQEEKQNARLLAGLLLVNITVVSLIILLVVYYDPNDLTDVRTLLAFATIFMAIVLYGLNRWGFTQLARHSFILLLAIMFVAVPYTGDFSEMSAFVVVPMLLGGMFYTFRQSFALNIIIIVSVFILNSIVVEEPIWVRRILWYFILFAGALVLVFKQHLQALEIIRRRELDDANAHLRATFAAIPDFLFEINTQEELVSYHVPDSASLDIPSFEPFIGRNISDSLPQDAAKIVLQAVENAKQIGAHSGAIFSLDLNNETHSFEVSISTKQELGKSNQDRSFVILARDITERRQAELLRDEHTRLEVELEKEKELAELRSQLMSMITHEVRTPMAVIQTSIDMLTKYRDRLSQKQHDDKFRMIAEQVKRLDDLLNNVSLLNKGRRGFLQFNPLPMDIAGFCQQLVDDLQVIVQDNNELVFTAEGRFELVNLDEHLLRHALVNLITNGLKYSPQGGVVKVNLSGDTGQIHITVADEGIGIPADDIENLFQPFHRASNVGEIQGTGLGLAITRDAIRMQGGEVTCHSVLGQGTTFIVNLPIEAYG